MNERITEQAPPQPATGDMWLEVIKDMEERRKHGIQKYGVPVQPFNGRNALIGVNQEVLDLAVYLRQSIEEQKPKLAEQARHSSIPKNHGPCAVCGQDVIHCYPWFNKNPDKYPEAKAYHDECFKKASV